MDRLFAILLSLQQRQETAQTLSEKFEVSKRTILRDIQSLAEMGIPVYALTGPKGGFRLIEGYQLSPLQLDFGEALTILFALHSVTKMQETPFNQERWTVLDKVRMMIPEEVLKQIEPVLHKVQVAIPRRNYKTPFLSSIIKYTVESAWVCIFYRSEHHQRWLKIKPLKVFTEHGFWYCSAFSHTHGQERTFRIDRIESLQDTDEPDNLEQHKQKAHTETERLPTRVRARLTYKGMLRVEKDEHISDQIRAVSDEEWELDFICPPSEWNWFIRFFYSLGMEVEVLEPDSLREEIYRLIEQLSDRYKPIGTKKGESAANEN
jgi:predicted DNA-binding transcriptional regulator YafY